MHSWLVIIVTIILALILAILPIPTWAVWVRPAWVLMVLIYWAMVMPNRVSSGFAWVTGIVVDLLNGSVLGEHALVFTLIIYLVTRMNLRLRMYPIMQQGLSVFVFVLLYQFIIYCIQGFVGELPRSHLYWLSSVSSMLLWPWLFVILRDCRHWLRVT